jgi:cytochrome c oxidase assembly protein subunit 15
MTDWHLVTDTFPPLSEEKWEEAFEQYKQFPEYKIINIHNDFKLSDYKFIYFWEWFHRFIGRIIGLVFIIPFLYFLLKKKLDSSTIKKCMILLGMGAFQGFLGWFMVKSGLIDNPDVSHYRLALHLTFAFITFAYTLWVALDLIYPERVKIEKTLRTIARFALVFLIVQIIYGGFVAGLNAGLIHNHWPLMSDGQLFHESILLEKESWILRFTEGKSGVQFIHRTLAYLVVGCIVFLYFKGRKHMLSLAQKRGLRMLLLLVLIQFILGVLTLLLGVPMWLGLTHQIMAFLLLATMTFTLHRLSK